MATDPLGQQPCLHKRGEFETATQHKANETSGEALLQFACVFVSLLLLLRCVQVVRCYGASGRRLIVLGYNATLTTAVEAPRQPKRHFDQIKALTRVNPRILRCLEVRRGVSDNDRFVGCRV